jgi:prepilin-type N-terminal cleavage/methylation domain-containing protein
MTSLNPSLRLALINKAKSKKNIFQKGFTLVELMVVVGIVGVLSAVALPNLLSNKDRAEAQTTVGSIKAFADQCNNNQQTENPSTIDVPALITDNMAGDVCGTISTAGLFVPSGEVTFSNAAPFAKPDSLEGIRCGVNPSGVVQTANGTTHATCTFTVPAGGGQVTGEWS